MNNDKSKDKMYTLKKLATFFCLLYQYPWFLQLAEKTQRKQATLNKKEMSSYLTWKAWKMIWMIR